MVTLQWLQISEFRSVKPGTRLTFNAGHNVLLGQNGTGKTMLLDLIVAAVTSDFTAFQDEAFSLSYALVSDEAELTVSVRHEGPPPATPSGLTSAPESSRVSFTAEFIGKSTGGRFKVDAEGQTGSVQRLDETAPRLPLKTSGLRLGVTVTEGLVRCWSRRSEPKARDWLPETFSLFNASATRRFDEALGYFDDLGKARIEVRQAPDVTLSGHTPSADSIEGLAKVRAMRDWGASRYVLTDAELPFLQRAVQLLGFDSAEVILEAHRPASDGSGPLMHLGPLRFDFRLRNGKRVPEEMLGHGQKRLLAFAHYAAWAESVIIADELGSGLHASWVRACFDMVGERQLFLTSQNPLLLNCLEFQSVEAVQSTFILCRWEPAAGQLVWKNMPEDSARDFFDSYNLGFQRVGELLQTKGLG